MHGLMGGGWKRGATTVDAKDPGGETLGVSAKTYRRATPPRQSSTLHGRYYRSALYRLLARINAYLVRWIRNKYRRLANVRASRQRFAELTRTTPTRFTHWRWVRAAW